MRLVGTADRNADPNLRLADLKSCKPLARYPTRLGLAKSEFRRVPKGR